MGKVHGGLARAGKVKGSTPVVEKQEKPKKKTGRARMRERVNYHQYGNTRPGPNNNYRDDKQTEK